jgi:hypothetical protein
MIEPKPALIEVNIFSNEQVSQIIFEKIAQKVLKHRKGDRLHEAITSFAIDTQRMTPAVLALGTCLFGFEEMPHRGQPQQVV